MNREQQKQVWKQILQNFRPYSGYKVEDYYGVSLIKRKRGGLYSLKLIHDYDSNGKFSTAYEMEDFQRVVKTLEILEWFAKDDHLRAVQDNKEIDLDATDEELDSKEIDF